MTQRVVLAYSGGLDTSVAVKWIQEEWGAEVVALAVDVGQEPRADAAYWETIRQRALVAGAIEARVVDAREEYAARFVVNAIKANARYEGKYPLVSWLSRLVIARHLVAAAREFSADAVAHGCTGKGNDQVRFEVALRTLAPDLESITLERDVMREKSRLETRYAETVYDGLWYSPLREAFDAFIESTQRHVTGEVRLRLQPGQCTAVGRRAERGLYDYALATYEADDAFRHEDAAGFVRLWGLSVETWSKRQRIEEPVVRPESAS